MNNSFDDVSYQSHETWFAKQYPEIQKRKATIEHWQEEAKNITINYWLHKRLLELANPLLKETQKTWLTVGDGYGFDASYLKEQGCHVMATDIGDAFLPLVKEKGMIDEYSVENVEKLSFENDSYDYVFCKEAFHHFPKAYLGVYEMLRVAKKGIILIEPQDPLSRMPLMLALKNICDRIDPKLLQKFWKNRYSFEEVGNYVFKLADRDMEKLAMGLNLPAIAFKGINNAYWKRGFDKELANNNNATFKKLKRKVLFHDVLSKLSIMPHHVLSAIIFKTLPSEETKQQLKEEGYTYYEFPKNPYL